MSLNPRLLLPPNDMIYSANETVDEAIERNKTLYVDGLIDLRGLEHRVEIILTRKGLHAP